MRALTTTTQNQISAGLLIVRLILGFVIFAHGAQKVLGVWGGNGLEGTVGWMSSMGIPAFMAYLSAFTEFIGGILMMLGLITRPVALAVCINMLVAVLTVHLKNGFLGQGGMEFALTLALLALAILIAGPGKYSLDQKLFLHNDSIIAR